MQIKRWIRDGNHGLKEQDIDTTEGLLEVTGRMLDKACSQDIVGECLFEGEDGKTYVGTVEFCISEANPDYVKEVLEADDGDAEEG